MEGGREKGRQREKGGREGKETGKEGKRNLNGFLKSLGLKRKPPLFSFIQISFCVEVVLGRMCTMYPEDRRAAHRCSLTFSGTNCIQASHTIRFISKPNCLYPIY